MQMTPWAEMHLAKACAARPHADPASCEDLRPSLGLRLCAEVALGLALMHDAGYAHR
jgi:hypothetical protein